MNGAAAIWRAMLGLLRHRLAMRQPVAGEPAPASVPQAVTAFLDGHHVVSLAVIEAAGPWAASCFYAFDAAAMTLVVMTSAATRHGRAMLACPRISGTVAGQPGAVSDIRGLQFEATATRLSGKEQRDAALRFVRRHPMAVVMPSDVWTLNLETVKYTDNRIAFARKLHWSRSAGEGAAEGGSAS